MADTQGQKCPDPKCESDDVVEAVEITASRPWGTGYMILMCAVCGERVGDSRIWVGF